ncbi:hypothetical protein QBC43DRAFT_220515, partial [Cladorrhinum sp. PSN259]
GLLPLLKSIHRPTELKKYAGETFGVDGYVWLHRGAIACAIELAQGKPTRKYVNFAMERVKMFKHFGVTPYLVFDGDYLPSKAKTEESREKRRRECMKTGLALLKAGKPSQAHMELQKAIDVTPEMARHFIEELKKENIPYVVAPYEADAQLVYLERQGIISGIVSEDSDLLVFGAKRLLTKMDGHGQCVEINRKDFCLVREISLTEWTDNEFRHMAIFSGCDYLAGINTVGLKTAYRLIRKHKTAERVIKMIRFDTKYKLPENYLEEFKQAEHTFLYQRVFCPKKQDIVHLTEPDVSVDLSEMPFIGAPVETELARAIAVGDVHPITKKPIILPPSPGKRRISQTFASTTAPSKRLGKPIDEYFADKRIPLGEMDPNCFNIDPDRNAGTAVEAPRAIVFPLPRPYVEAVEEPAPPARRYTSIANAMRRRSEPISSILNSMNAQTSDHRRKTTGSIIPAHRDANFSTRPPKKARLCDDLPALGAMKETPERSKFFSATKQTKATKNLDPILMSDDSIDEAFMSLPDFDDWKPEKPASRPRTSEISIFEEASSVVVAKKMPPTGAKTQEPDTSATEEVEVPASSPLQQEPAESVCHSKPTSARRMGDVLKGFSYQTAQPRTRFAHGLPTPASSAPSTSTPRSSSSKGKLPSSSQTPMLTPLQRLGAQAIQRNHPRPVSSIPRMTKSSSGLPSSSFPVNPAFIPLPRVDLAEVETLNKPIGSEDHLIPSSDGEHEEEDREQERVVPSRRFDLSHLRGIFPFRNLRYLSNTRLRYFYFLWSTSCLRCANAVFPQDRLRDYTNSFNGLLSLIPAKMYYGEDTSDQWKKRKQTKEEARAAKRGKLDPDSELHKNAKEILDERARNKRKAQELEADDNSDNNSGDDDTDLGELVDIEKEKPLEGLKKKVEKEKPDVEEEDKEETKVTAAKEKRVEGEPTVEQTTKNLSAKEQKDAKKSAKKQKKEEAKRLKIEAAATPSKTAAPAAKDEEEKEDEEQEEPDVPEVQQSTEVDSNRDDNDEMAPIDVSGLVDEKDSSADSNSPRDSPLFDFSAAAKPDSTEEAPASAATSISSAVPPSEKPKYLKIPVDPATQARLRARLDAKLGQFKQKRKAVDPEGKPIKTRTELIEARRVAELKRKEHKKELRKLAKIEEEKKREETLASARNSPALSSLLAGDDDKASNHFSFGRLAFTDGTTLSHDASYEKTPGLAKKKGPSDPKTALLKLENQKKRLAALDEGKRKDIEEKETWLAARKRAEGEKVVDNENLLKKALKRKEKAKKKSEKEWKDRAEGVTKAIYDRQKKREANLQKRKDDKMAHKKGKGGKKKNSGVQTKSKSRPGFEGGFGGRK